jgi:hypothetical protein
MGNALLAENYLEATMPSGMEQELDAKHNESLSIWNSFAKRHTLFWTSSPQEEEKVLRFARLGSLMSTVMLALMGAVEFVFVALLLWQILR